MRQSNLSKCDVATADLKTEGYEMLATVFTKGSCRHIHRKGFLYAVSDITGHSRKNITEAEAWRLFNAVTLKINPDPQPKSNLEDIDATLKELEDNLKIISVRILSYISDFIDKRIERLS